MPGHTAHSKPGVPLHACECEAPAHPNWERRSNEEWLRPFVPHGLADFTYSLTRRWEGHIQWVARYFPKDPDKHPLSGEVPQKYRAKSMTPSPRLTEHSAFRAALDFLWGRHKLWHPECTVPTIVKEAMAANNCCISRGGVSPACEVAIDALRATGLANSIERGPRQTPCGLGAFHQVPINRDGNCVSTAAAVGIESHTQTHQ